MYSVHGLRRLGCLCRIGILLSCSARVQVPVTVLLKEYLPGTHGVAVNEIRMMGALHGIPGFGEKWRAANDMDPKQPPIVPLLGVPGLSCHAT